jgi:S-adenosylmethionine:tRNA ribosyltransferase-isomerase
MDSRIENYDYPLPRELIAQRPLAYRADARLMRVDRRSGSIEHHHFRDLPQLLSVGDCLVLNDTKVVPARLIGYRAATGGRWEGLFLAAKSCDVWQILAKARGKLTAGETIMLQDRFAHDDTPLHLLTRLSDGSWYARPQSNEEPYTVLDRIGRVPLPHYIRGGEMLETDRHDYQTVFARNPGSVAAPTAGLHFTAELLDDLHLRGMKLVWVTLHVGIDTFRPISTRWIGEHSMHSEWAELTEPSAEQLRRCRRDGGRIVAVGSTAVRVLETAAASGSFQPLHGPTSLYIHPPYEFRSVDALITNFHLPRTTLLVLVRTFGGDQLMRRAYEEAVRERYRFFSYGDAMLIE